MNILCWFYFYRLKDIVVVLFVCQSGGERYQIYAYPTGNNLLMYSMANNYKSTKDGCDVGFGILN